MLGVTYMFPAEGSGSSDGICFRILAEDACALDGPDSGLAVCGNGDALLRTCTSDYRQRVTYRINLVEWLTMVENEAGADQQGHPQNGFT